MSRHITRNGTRYQFSIDPESKLRLIYSQACIERLTNTEVNQSAVVRVALRYLVQHLEELSTTTTTTSSSTNPTGTTDILKYHLRTAIEGSRSAPTASIDELKALASLPSFSELTAQLQQP